MTQASFVVVSELIAKKLKSHAEGEFVECLVATLELLAPEKKNQAVPKCQFVSENREPEKFFFSKLTLAKTRLHSRLTGLNLENQLQEASSSLPPDIRCLPKEKLFQPSHLVTLI